MKNVFELLLNYYLKKPNDFLFVDSEKEASVKDVFLSSCGIAHSLLRKGIDNSPILVFVDRSMKAIIAFFGIALSHNYYLPLDENIPEEKLEQILKDSHAKAYFSFHGREVPSLSKLDFDSSIKEVLPQNEMNRLLSSTEANSPLYLMFTSGSTGKPKGVLKSHKNILSFVENFSETFPFLENGQRIMNQTPFFFDASSKDIYLTLKYQGTLYIPDKNSFALPQTTIEYLNNNKITMISWVPSALTLIAKLRTLDFMKPEYLKYVFFVGEVFQPKYLNIWLKALPNTRFFNIYGSTELAGVSLAYEVTHEMNENEPLPTGKPLKNNEVFLDNGEIVISSEQIALGYINDSEKNKTTFRETSKGKLLYTGDYAYLDKDENFVFSTRMDFQIKHLGYRIELQEIDTLLTSLEYIDSCCALYDKEKDKIVLFAVLNQVVENPVKQILSDAKKKLQFYMLPNKVVVLDKMPLNANGKIDRTKLGNYLKE